MKVEIFPNGDVKNFWRESDGNAMVENWDFEVDFSEGKRTANIVLNDKILNNVNRYYLDGDTVKRRTDEEINATDDAKNYFADLRIRELYIKYRDKIVYEEIKKNETLNDKELSVINKKIG